MGTVYIGSVSVGTFPATEGASGDIYLGSIIVGSFGPLQLMGLVYLDGVLIGTYSLTGAPPTGVGIGPSTLIYLQKLFEVRVYISGGINWNYTRFGLKDALWLERNPWVTISIPGGIPRRQRLSTRTAENGILRCFDDRAVFTLFRNTDVRSDSGNQYLIAQSTIDSDYAATKVIFIYKGTRKTVSSGEEAEDIVWYTFTNFRIEEARNSIDERNEHIWEISFNADSVERSEP